MSPPDDLIVGIPAGRTLAFERLHDRSAIRVDVRPSCAPFAGGEWYCFEHGEGFPGVAGLVAHLLHRPKGRHALVFFCDRHGLEEPSRPALLRLRARVRLAGTPPESTGAGTGATP